MSLVVIPSTFFSYNNKKFVTDVSELFGNYPASQKSQTICIKSAKTGQIAPFKFERAFTSEACDEDVAGWIFGYCGNKPELNDLTMVVLND
jgi:hypothetical protein